MKTIDEKYLEKVTRVYGIKCREILVELAGHADPDVDEDILLNQAVDIAYDSQFYLRAELGRLKFNS